MSSRQPRGNSAISVQVTGLSGIQKAFRPLMEPEITILFDAANKRGAQLYAKALRPEARRVSKRMGRAVRVRRARTGRPDWVVGSRRKVAFFWPFVIGGTKDHGPRKARLLAWEGPNGLIRAARVRGVPANPIVERVAKANERRIADAISIDFGKQAGL